MPRRLQRPSCAARLSAVRRYPATGSADQSSSGNGYSARSRLPPAPAPPAPAGETSALRRGAPAAAAAGTVAGTGTVIDVAARPVRSRRGETHSGTIARRAVSISGVEAAIVVATRRATAD